MCTDLKFKIMGSLTFTHIPWDIIEPHGKQANLNHSQPLQRLHDRGGLNPLEAIAVIEDRGYNTVFSITLQEAESRLSKLIDEYEANKSKKEQ